MRNGNYDESTVLQAHNPAGGYAPMVVLPGVSLPFDSSMYLTIDGERWVSGAPRSVAIDTQQRTVVTTITVIRADQ